jgi:crotonobetainyl-CoA:carnitine CoA-transferase CaiB-like acyl-CoA transferase
MSGALDGVVVADFSRVLAGPLATMILGDLGADVIKVERPETGDETRSWGPPWSGDTSTYYLAINRNKRSITLDLHDENDRELALRLAKRADILVENFIPGTMDRHGLGYEQLHEANRKLVYCSISGFGSQGDAAVLPGYDFLVQALSGLMSITGDPGGHPLKAGVAIVDMITGLYAVSGILAALRARDTSGAGQHVEVSLLDSALSALLNQGSGFLNAGVIPVAQGNRHPSIAPYQIYQAADTAFAVAVGNNGTWKRLCDAVGQPGLTDDPRFATNPDRVANINDLEELLTATFRKRSADEWVRLLSTAGVPAGTVNDVGQAYALAERLGIAAITVGSDSGGEVIRTARSPLVLNETPVVSANSPPGLGEHNDEIRRWLEDG